MFELSPTFLARISFAKCMCQSCVSLTFVALCKLGSSSNDYLWPLYIASSLVRQYCRVTLSIVLYIAYVDIVDLLCQLFLTLNAHVYTVSVTVVVL